MPIIAQLFVFLGTDHRIALPLRIAILRILRPAESAVRRLIVIAARGLVLKDVVPRPMPAGGIVGLGGSSRPPSFQLFDGRKSFVRVRKPRKIARLEPRIRVIGHDPRISALWHAPAAKPEPELVPVEDGRISAARLSRRLHALKLALADIPRQAKRLVRWQARRERLDFARRSFKLPLRPGHPPGYRARPDHDIDNILAECHRLALDAQRADTS